VHHAGVLLKILEERTSLKRLVLIAVSIACLVAGIYSLRLRSSSEPESNAALAGDENPSTPIVTDQLKKLVPAATAGAGNLTDPRGDALFQAALKDYDKRSYARAIDGFYKASAIDPGAPAPHFYLGICYLLTNDTAASIPELHLTARLGEKTFGERAHYYLAQAFWRQHESKRAEQELDMIIRAAGSLKRDAEIMKGAMYVADAH
jgi:TolA-binding protein